MGNLKKLRKKYNTPYHPWQKERIVAEKELITEYGLKNKKEIWRHSSLLTKFKNIAKETISSSKAQSMKEGEQLLSRLKSLGLLSDGSTLNDVLTLNDKDILERRLQTVITRKGLARSLKQARQFITHSHISLNGVIVSSPSYLVKKSEEDKIEFNPRSTLSDVEHPERNIEVAKTLGKGKDSVDATTKETVKETTEEIVKETTKDATEKVVVEE
jgi:small subunit ribosomal protein S4